MNLCRIWLAMTTSNIHAFHILNSKRWSGFSHSFAITVTVAVPGQLVGLSTLEDMLGLGLGFKLLTGGHFLALISNKSSSSWLMQNQDFTLLGHIINPIVLLLDQDEIVKFVYNWLKGVNGGAAKSNLAPPPKKRAPRLIIIKKEMIESNRHTKGHRKFGRLNVCCVSGKKPTISIRNQKKQSVYVKAVQSSWPFSLIYAKNTYAYTPIRRCASFWRTVSEY